MKFAALGRTKWLYKTIEHLIVCGHQPVLIGTSPAAPEYEVDQDDFRVLAERTGCPFFCDPKINNPAVSDLIGKSRAEVAVSVNWVSTIPNETLDLFPYGILNAHLGDLPRYRGNATPNWAILNGECKIVLCIHQMSEELDQGPVLLKRDLRIDKTTYIKDIYSFMEINIPLMFAEALTGLESGRLAFQPQPTDPSLSLRCFPRTPEDGLIDWTHSAEQIHRLIRASSEPFKGAYTYLNQTRITVWRGRCGELPYPWLGVPGQVAFVDKEKSEVTVLTGSGVIILETVETEQEGVVPPAKIIKSTRVRLGPPVR